MIVAGVVLFFVIPAALLAEILRCVGLELRRDRIPILLYHRLLSKQAIEEGRAPDTEPIYVSYDDRFAAQMDYLVANGYTTLSLDEFVAVRRRETPPPRRPLVLTFDDGYASNYTLAWPILRRLGLKATIFVAPEPDAYTRELVAGVDGFLDPDQMRELDRGGVAIESHTMTHCILSEMDDAAARRELSESSRYLGAILGRPVRHLAVPRSGGSRRVRRLAREEGYVTACGNDKGSSNGWSNLYALPRIVIERDTTVEDFARALGPRRAIILRLVGNVKRLPALLFGPTAAQRIREALLASPVGGMLQTRRLIRLLAVGALAYALAIAAFAWSLM